VSDILKDCKIGFVGAGMMAEVIMEGLASTGARLMASDPDPARQARAAGISGVRVMPDNRALVSAADLVILAVKPQVAQAVLKEIGPVFEPGKTLLSIVAGLCMETMRRYLPPGVTMVRAMPNTPALIGAGITGVAADEADASAGELARIILAPLGTVVEVSEHHLDAVTGLSGSGPAYVALFAEALIEGGVKAGLGRAMATELAVQTLLGTAKMLAGGVTPLSLRERVTSPGGTTAFGLYALERGGVRAAIIDAVCDATSRAGELGG